MMNVDGLECGGSPIILFLLNFLFGAIRAFSLRCQHKGRPENSLIGEAIAAFIAPIEHKARFF